MPRPDVTELGDYAVELARGAGELVRARATSDADLHVDAKTTNTDLVTEVDQASELWLVSRLATDRPDDAVLGEERGGRDGTSGVRWVLDPIDGTVNFVLGLPQYAVSVAAQIGEEFVAGAVYNPISRELFRATRGGGAWLDDRRLSGPRRVELSRAVVGTGFGYAAAKRAGQAAVIAQLLPRVGDIRRLGSAALDLCAVACGRLDAYFETGLSPWDYGAGVLIAAEAGCAVSGLRGRPASSQLAAATGPDLAADFFALLEELQADEV